MKIEISFINSRWLVNGKRLSEMNHDEQVFMDNFFREMKTDSYQNRINNIQVVYQTVAA